MSFNILYVNVTKYSERQEGVFQRLKELRVGEVIRTDSTVHAEDVLGEVAIRLIISENDLDSWDEGARWLIELQQLPFKNLSFMLIHTRVLDQLQRSFLAQRSIQVHNANDLGRMIEKIRQLAKSDSFKSDTRH